jgi:methyl-accepting chemotaxis protein
MDMHTPGTRKTRSIQLKIGLILISLTTLILAIFGVYQYYKISTRKTAELRTAADNAVEKLAESLVMPLWNYARKETEHIILSEMRDRNIYAVLIRKVSDNSISTGKIRDEDWQIKNTTDEVEGEYIVTRKAVVKDEDTLATVEVYLTRRFLQEELTREVIGIVVIVLVLDISIFIVLTFTLQSMLLRPINKLLILANGIADGNFDQAIPIYQHDEIGTLADASLP